MCGIAGFVGSNLPVSEADARLASMCGAIAHRGPDDEGRFVVPGVALGMRRLSIIDVAGGHQPISNEDGQVTVVFNGEIYNHHTLRQRLIANGHQFRTRSDTETLVHLYEEAGERMVDELEGMFAFAIWDARRAQLFAARDHLGIKPLYYQSTSEGVTLMSELRSLLATQRTPELSPVAVAAYLALGYVPDPLCIFEGVRKLPPGHWLRWSRSAGLTVTPYWHPRRDEAAPRDERAVIEELRALLDASVRAHMESEVPLGAFLSGGIDSSTVVALMARASDQRVKTFSIGFDDPRYDESTHAAAVARAIGTDHTELIVQPDADALVEEVVHSFDEPFSDASALPTYLVAQLARERLTVALSGDGGDELFGGYTRYAELGENPALRSSVLRVASRAVGRRLPHAFPYRNRLVALGGSERERYASTVAMKLAPELGGIAQPWLVRSDPTAGLFDTWFDAAGNRDFLSQAMLVDLQSYLPGDILTKVDRTTMAVSLEARVPFLTPRIAEFAAALPSHLKIRHGQGKWILRQAIESLVPPAVLSHPKRGFGVPLDTWFRGELRGRLDALQAADSPLRQYVDSSAVQRITTEHLGGRRDHKGSCWRLLVLDVWLRALRRGDLARRLTPSDTLRAMTARATTSALERP